MVASRLPTLKDVAEAADVHVATASRALSDDKGHLVNDETRIRVRAVAQALGYRTNAVAQSLRKGSTGALGVAVADLANPFIVSLLRGIEYESRSRDSMPLVVETHDDPQTLRNVVTRLIRNRVDGIILCAAQLNDEELVNDLEKQVPVVLAVRGYASTSDPEARSNHVEVLQDDFSGARSAVNHLISLGHTRIAQIPGRPEISSFVGRTEGFKAAIEAHPHVKDLSSGTFALESSVAEGRRLAADLLRRSPERRPTAIFAHNDLMAVGALDALADAGLKCPEDVSIVGYNDVPLIDHLNPPLSTVRLPGFEMGRHSARLAFSLIAGEELPDTRIMLAPEFVERASTRRPSDNA